MKAAYTNILVLLAMSLLFAAAMSGLLPKGNSNGDICGVSQEDLFECKPAVAAGTACPPPTPACCAALEKANVTCFCTFKNNKYLPLMGINVTRAMQLPAKCDPTLTAHC